MDFFTKNKLLFWCVIILAILNIATLGSFWFTAPGQGRNRPAEKAPDGGKLMKERLDLTDEQAERFERIRTEHFARTRPLQDAMHRIRLDLLHEIFQPQPDEAVIQKLQTELQNKHGQFETNLFAHFRELKNACKPEQIKELKIMLRELIDSTRPRAAGQKMPPPGQGPRPGPGHRHPPPP